MNWDSLFSELKARIDYRRWFRQTLKSSINGGDEIFFESFILFWITIITLLAISVVAIVCLGNEFIEPLTRNLFVIFVAVLMIVQMEALVLLMNRRLLAARAIVAWSVATAVCVAVALTGGLPWSVATPALILPPTIFFCLYGVRSGLAVAVGLPAICGAQTMLVDPGHLVDLQPRAAAVFDRGMIVAITYVFVVLTLIVYARANALSRAQQNAEREKLLNLANEDTLTGIANARHFNLRLEQACAKIDHYGGELAVLYVDFDDFKQINDDFGHAMGDEVLRRIAQRLRLMLRREDTVARLGGDEFAILVDVVSDDQQVERMIERVCELVAEPVDVDDLRHTIGASVGRALYPTDVADRRAIVEFADRDMYRVKLEKRSKASSAA